MTTVGLSQALTLTSASSAANGMDLFMMKSLDCGTR
jgi:hypothetical protein